MTKDRDKTRAERGVTRRRFVWSAAAGALTLGAAVPLHSVSAQTVHRLRYINFGEKNSIWAEPTFELQRQVEKRSNGALKVDWAGGPEVVGPFQAVEAVSKGVFDMCHTATSYYTAAVPETISLASGRASLKVLRDSGVIAGLDELHRKNLGVTLIGIATSGVGYCFMANRPPANLAFFKGRRFRSIPIFDPVLSSLGAVTTTISPTEVYSALEKGIVDGTGWPEINIADRGFHKHAKYMMRPGFYHSRTPTLMNVRALERLPAELRKVLVESMQAADDWSAELFRTSSAKEFETMRQQGLIEVSLSDAEAKEFTAMTERVLWEKIIATSPTEGPRLRALYEKAAAMA